MDGYNRFYFASDGGTYIYAPNNLYSSVMTLIASSVIFKCEIDKVTSYKNLHIGAGGATTPTLFLDGASNQSVSSRIIFGDSGSTIYKNGMVIYYDSSDKKLKFSGDSDNDNQIDTPNAITIKRNNNYVGILKDNPTVPLEVGGAITASGTIKSSAGFRFPDNTIQSTAVSLPTYLFSPSYFKCYLGGTLPDNFTETKQSYFGAIALNIGNYTYTSSEIIIPANGVYEISYNLHVRSTVSGDRQVPVTHIRINDAYVDNRRQAVFMGYMRNGFGAGGNNREAAGSAQTILSLNSGDKVNMYAHREGNSGTPTIQYGSHINIKRIA